MKKLALFALAAVLVLGLCACRMGSEEPTEVTDPVTDPPAATTPDPTIVDPTVMDPIIDPTIDSNVPDPSVDNDHMIDPTDGGSVTPDANA